MSTIKYFMVVNLQRGIVNSLRSFATLCGQGGPLTNPPDTAGRQ
jgi:hypothetical protein